MTMSKKEEQVMKKRLIRQWLPLAALAAGLVGAAIGELVGQPNSWGWFVAGATVAAVAALLQARRQH